MIRWFVPPEVYPDTDNGKPLAYVSLAAQRDEHVEKAKAAHSAKR